VATGRARIFRRKEITVEAVLASYGGGQQNLAAVLEARRAEVDARIQVLDLERESARIWARLRYTYLETEEVK